MSNKKVFATIGASNHTDGIRANYDYYVTDPRAVLELLKKEVFRHEIWEPACGEGSNTRTN